MPHNKALHLTLANVAKMGDDHHVFRVGSAVHGRGAQVSAGVSPLDVEPEPTKT